MRNSIRFLGLVTAAAAAVGCAQMQSAAKKAGVDETAVEDAAEQTKDAAEEAAADAPKTVVQTLVLQGQHTTLATALEKAGLYSTLGEAGPYTVFAPTDEAFRKLDKETRDALLDGDDTSALRELLMAHVVEGEGLQVKDLVERDALTMMSGGNLQVEASGDKREVKVGGVELAIPDLECSNGVVHVLDAVLKPGGNS
jgi:uncharacterized surface protein with fasciclin (FAS1) repeats